MEPEAAFERRPKCLGLETWESTLSHSRNPSMIYGILPNTLRDIGVSGGQGLGSRL